VAVSSDRRPYGRLEREVAAVLAAGDRPMTPAEVRQMLAGELAYTTVMTVLSRLADKGLARREPRGRAYAYTAVRDEAEVTAEQMRRLLDAGGDRAAVLTRFVGTLSDADEQLVLELLAGSDEEADQQ
jgi:predicted transcriptional regulator